MKVRKWTVKTADGQTATFLTTLNANKQTIERKAQKLVKGEYTIKAGEVSTVRER